MEFLSAKATNSRLMGSIGLVIKWKKEEYYFNQYFLLDSEGLGICDYVSLINPSEKEDYKEEQRLMGGLGSDKINLSEEESLFLLKIFYDKNIRYNRELPENSEEFIKAINKFNESLELIKYENMYLNNYMGQKINISNYNDLYNLYKEILYTKLSKKIEDEIEFINYIVMRFIARDTESLFYFSSNEELSNMSITNINGMLLKNKVIDKKNNKYLCEVLFEDSDGYYTCKIGISIDKYNENNLICDKFKLKSFLVSDIEELFDFEVFDEIKKEEFISIYEVKNREDFIEKFHEDNLFLQKAEVEEGTFFTRFNFDNNHVKEEIYLISNDIKAIYYIQEDRIFVGTYSDRDRSYITKLLENNYKEYLNIVEHIYFEENVLYDYIESCAVDFDDFLDN